jgi:hypothetical protein
MARYAPSKQLLPSLFNEGDRKDRSPFFIFHLFWSQNMSQIHRSLWRAASHVHEILQRQPIVRRSLPLVQWQRCHVLAASLEAACQHNWQLAAGCRRVELAVAVADLEQALLRWSDQLKLDSAPNPAPSIADLYRDFVALQDEFPEFEHDPDLQLLAVTTEPVVLDGIELGRFQIRLNNQRIYKAQPYTVVALDPNPAASNKDVTHPHVSDEHVCEGDGHLAIVRALAEGRLLDFFVMVDRLLHTYAPGRAYVELSTWNGTPCNDCGLITDEGGYFSCSRCEEEVCGDCGTVCSVCEQFYCNGCSSSCQWCDSATCVSCLEQCRSCGQRVCPECLNQDLCEQCYEEQIESDQESTDQCVPSDAAEAPVQPDSLGQAVIST